MTKEIRLRLYLFNENMAYNEKKIIGGIQMTVLIMYAIVMLFTVLMVVSIGTSMMKY